jgi:NitT/TauT family transport system substrate-binding protein
MSAQNSRNDDETGTGEPCTANSNMSHSQTLSRRAFLGVGVSTAVGLGFGTAPLGARNQATRFTVRIASNQGIENATLQRLMLDMGYLGDLSLDGEVVESKSISAPMDALLNDQADICMISAFAGVLPAIEQGKALRLVGAAMLAPALAAYVADPRIRKVKDLKGRTIGVGPQNGLLHVLMEALLFKHGVDPAAVKFVNVGGNAQVLEAVIAGKVDAGLSGIAGEADRGKAHMLDDGRLWRELPQYTYQPAYASLRAIKEQPEALGRCLAAYTKLFRFLSTRGSESAYLDARRRAVPDDNRTDGEAVWSFIQHEQPYAVEPGLSPERVAYMQQLNVRFGLQSKALPFDQVADMAPATIARRLVG